MLEHIILWHLVRTNFSFVLYNKFIKLINMQKFPTFTRNDLKLQQHGHHSNNTDKWMDRIVPCIFLAPYNNGLKCNLSCQTQHLSLQSFELTILG